MDDTHQSRTSDAAATRKRRSSILKNQRPPRTPFSELEFNVATPTDTAKSRRVSFSRRTGVAEFVTNEATTTWKNFYEEHNKSLESSGNESGANAPRPPIGHIGKRIFEQQFQEVEAVDFISTLDDHSSRNINTSMNNVNFTQQLASLECTNDDRLAMPVQTFEMSAFTDHQSKLFGDDLAVPTMGEASGRIDINFSAIQTIGEVKDDLDEIQKDLERAQSNVVCSGPFTGRKSLSEYIEVDLNATHISIKNDDDDMSITDTIHSPKVQDVSKNVSSSQVDKKSNLSKDWVADKENIALNPYVTPKETTNFAINDEDDKILVFDGKRLTIQSDREADIILKSNTDDLKPILPKESKPHQRKTIVLNVNDDLPNFVEDPMSTSMGLLGSASFKHSVMYDDDISITQPVVSNVNSMPEKDATIVTRALPLNIIFPNENKQEPERRKTILYDGNSGDVSITQAIPANILVNHDLEEEKAKIVEHNENEITDSQVLPNNIVLSNVNDADEKNKTETAEMDIGDISFTNVVPTNIMSSKYSIDNRKSIVFKDESGNISITEVLPANFIGVNKPEESKIINTSTSKESKEKRKTIMFEDSFGNISVTQALPSNIFIPETAANCEMNNTSIFAKDTNEKRKTIVFEDGSGNISMTQALPANIFVTKTSDNSEMNITTVFPKESNEKRKTIVFEDESGNISMTQALPANIFVPKNSDSSEMNNTTAFPKESNEKRKTIVFEDGSGNISITQALPANILVSTTTENCKMNNTTTSPKESKEKRKTIVFEDDAGNISVTQALPVNILIPETIENCEMNNITISPKESKEKRKTIVFEDDAGNISVTQALPVNILIPETIENCEMNNTTISPKESNEKRKTIMFKDSSGNISITQALPANILVPKNTQNSEINNTTTSPKESKEKRKTIVFEDDSGNISVTQALPPNILIPETIKNCEINNTTISPKESNEKRKTIMFKDSSGNISITQALPANIFGPETAGKFENNKTITSPKDSNEKRKTIVFEDGNISITQALPVQLLGPEQTKICEKIKSLVCETSVADLSVAKAVLVNVLIVNNATEKRNSILCDTNTQNASTDKFIYKETTDSESASHASDKQDIIPIIADAILPEEDSQNADDVENVIIKIRNDLSEAMSINKTCLMDISPDKRRKDVMEDNRITSSDSLIYIIRDTEGETQTDVEERPNKSLKWKDDVPKIQHSPLSIEYKEESDKEVTVDIPKKLNELRSVGVKDKTTAENRYYEKILSSDLDKSSEHDMSRASKSFKDANDTNELLEMLSDLTDRRHSKEPVKEVEKTEPEPRRLSVAPNRLSIVLSREDLLNNISMAQAALQRSIEIDESMEDVTSDTPVEVSLPPKKAVRVSNEVVKKLQFEDESTSETSIKSDLKGSPLKKTAFGETAYMREGNKGNVIPSYLKEVSEDIKALMNDLVKPNADNAPFQSAEKSLKREASTCSTQIQANLITSSQIDLDSDLASVTDGVYDIDKESMPSLEKPYSPRSSLKSDSEKHDDNLPMLSFRPKRYSASPPSQERVIVFDHNNPLNNICLSPIDYSEVHRYNPLKSNDPLGVESQSLRSKDSGEQINTHFVGNVTVSHSMQPSGDSVPDKSDAQSLLSKTSKRSSIDEAVSVRVCELKDTKVNTLIAMKTNKDLLEASSSLTLVDDTLAKSKFDVDSDMETAPSTTSTKSNSPVKVIYHNDDQKVTSPKLDSDLTSNDESDTFRTTTKGKKRIYSPTKRDKNKHYGLAALDITPKPTTKMQKLSNSPNPHLPGTDSLPITTSPGNQEPTAEKDDYRSKSSAYVESSDEFERLKEKKRSPRKSKKPGTDVTVQQLITKYDIPGIDQDALNKQIIKALSGSDSSTAPNTVSLTDVQNESKSPDIVSSFTSSKNQNGMREACSVTTTETHTTSSRSMKIDWQTEVTETSSNVISECESSVNVVAKIDMLPFMGSNECEWEASGADTWCFRLLHARLRLTARLAHRHDNATRTRVRADTPVTGVALETAHKDKKNSVATLCVRFAAEAMRYFIGQGVSRAGDVPSLLRRCAGVARVALRWGRAMHEARLHLAYTLSADGCLALKVGGEHPSAVGVGGDDAAGAGGGGRARGAVAARVQRACVARGVGRARARGRGARAAGAAAARLGARAADRLENLQIPQEQNPGRRHPWLVTYAIACYVHRTSFTLVNIVRKPVQSLKPAVFGNFTFPVTYKIILILTFSHVSVHNSPASMIFQFYDIGRVPIRMTVSSGR